MIEVVAVTQDSSENILPLLTVFEARNPRLTRRHWRAFFHPPWPTPDDIRGFAIRSGGQYVGFTGLIQSEREIDGRRHRMVNQSTWVVLPEFRRHSLRMSSSVQRMESEKKLTATSLTPMSAFLPLYKSFGMQELETAQWVVLPTPSLRGVLRSAAYRVSARIDPALLSAADQLIYAHHRSTECRHLFIRGPAGDCYLVYVKTKGRTHHFAHVLYLSNPRVFADALEKVKFALLWHNRTLATLIDERLLRGVALPNTRRVPLATPRLYHSETLKAGQIDNLYSEFVLLPC